MTEQNKTKSENKSVKILILESHNSDIYVTGCLLTMDLEKWEMVKKKKKKKKIFDLSMKGVCK